MIFGDRELLGWQLLQKLKMDPRLDEIPVIVCSAAVKTLHEMEGHLTEQGVLAVVKPFTVDQLEEAIARAVPRPDGNATSARSLVREKDTPREARQPSG